MFAQDEWIAPKESFRATGVDENQTSICSGTVKCEFGAAKWSVAAFDRDRFPTSQSPVERQ